VRVTTVAVLLVAAIALAGLPGLVGIAPHVENQPWGVTTFDFLYTIDVSNFGTAPARNVTVRVALLRDFPPFQQVQSMNVETPGFTNEVDDLANRFAVYNLTELAPGATFMANLTSRVRVYGIDFAVSPESFTTGAPGPAFSSPEPFVESGDPRIVNRSIELRAESADMEDYAYRAYVWTTEHLTYETQPQERGAVWALKTGRGMCYEYANLYMALLRAQGLAAKRVNGWGERFESGERHHAESIAHAWDLVWTADQGWIPVDPTFGDRHLYENFLKINDMHVVLTEGVNRNFYRVAYTRTLGTNVQVDYVVHVLSKTEENLSVARTLVFGGLVSVPFLLTGVVTAQVLWERKKRVYIE